MSKSSKDDVERIFSSFDFNDNGFIEDSSLIITAFQLLGVLLSYSLKKKISSLDNISFKDFYSLYEEEKKEENKTIKSRKKEFKRGLKHFDKSRNGFIDFSDLEKLISNVYKDQKRFSNDELQKIFLVDEDKQVNYYKLVEKL